MVQKRSVCEGREQRLHDLILVQLDVRVVTTPFEDLTQLFDLVLLLEIVVETLFHEDSLLENLHLLGFNSLWVVFHNVVPTG